MDWWHWRIKKIIYKMRISETFLIWLNLIRWTLGKRRFWVENWCQKINFTWWKKKKKKYTLGHLLGIFNIDFNMREACNSCKCIIWHEEGVGTWWPWTGIYHFNIDATTFAWPIVSTHTPYSVSPSTRCPVIP